LRAAHDTGLEFARRHLQTRESHVLWMWPTGARSFSRYQQSRNERFPTRPTMST
jgi:hypothetical protein